MNEDDADDVADQVQVWVQQKEEEISTAEIRKRVIGLLETKDFQVTENYRNFKAVA